MSLVRGFVSGCSGTTPFLFSLGLRVFSSFLGFRGFAYGNF